MRQQLHSDLEFLRQYVEQPPFRYREPKWLVACTFDSPVWTMKCGHRMTIDWRVRVGRSEALLTSARHRELWTAFRSWVVLQSHPDATGRVPAPQTVYVKIRPVLTLIDYFLINAERLQIDEAGFGAVSKNLISADLQQRRGI